MRTLFVLLAWTASFAPQAQQPSTRVAGTVTLEGPAPKQKKPVPLPCAHCAPLYPNGLPREDLLLDARNRIQGAFVFVKAGLEGQKFEAPRIPVVIDQKGCRYEPRIVGVQVGQELVVRNSDPHPHCIHGLAFTNREFVVHQPAGGKDFSRTFERQETMVKIKDTIHVWMNGWIGVLDHPFFAVTDPGGNFEIQGLPPGAYTIEVWQEKCAPKTLEIQLKQNDRKTANVVLELKKE